MKVTMKLAGLIWVVLVWVACASAQVKKQDADLAAADSVKIKVSYFSAGKPGPGVLLTHQCNRDRTSWDGLATQMAEKRRRCTLRPTECIAFPPFKIKREKRIAAPRDIGETRTKSGLDRSEFGLRE